MRLKDVMQELVAELTTPSGQAMESDSLLFYVMDVIPDSLATKFDKLTGTHRTAFWSHRSGSPDRIYKFTPKFLKYLESVSIWNKGQYHVCRIKGGYGSNIYYFLVDFNAQDIEEGFIGVIETKPSYIKSDASYSIGGNMGVKPMFNLEGEEVHWSNVLSSHKSKGFGAMLYDAVLDYTGVLFSDNTLFSGSYNMWAHHLSKSAFFGALMAGPSGVKIIVPIDVSATNKNTISRRVSNFVAINDRSILSKSIRRFEYNTRGIDIFIEMGTIMINDTFKLKPDGGILRARKGVNKITFEDYCEEFSSLSELLDKLFEIRNTSFDGRSYIRISDTDVQDNRAHIKLLVVVLENVTLLLKNKSDGISVQVMD